jgi:hypothetical protein
MSVAACDDRFAAFTETVDHVRLGDADRVVRVDEVDFARWLVLFFGLLCLHTSASDLQRRDSSPSSMTGKGFSGSQPPARGASTGAAPARQLTDGRRQSPYPPVRAV